MGGLSSGPQETNKLDASLTRTQVPCNRSALPKMLMFLVQRANRLPGCCIILRQTWPVNQSALRKCCTGLGQPNAVDLLSLSACSSATASGLSARWPENRCESTLTPRPQLKSPAKKPAGYAAPSAAPAPVRQRSAQTHRPHRVRAGHALAVALATGSRPSRWVTGSRQAGSIWRRRQPAEV